MLFVYIQKYVDFVNSHTNVRQLILEMHNRQIFPSCNLNIVKKKRHNKYAEAKR